MLATFAWFAIAIVEPSAHPAYPIALDVVTNGRLVFRWDPRFPRLSPVSSESPADFVPTRIEAAAQVWRNAGLSLPTQASGSGVFRLLVPNLIEELSALNNPRAVTARLQEFGQEECEGVTQATCVLVMYDVDAVLLRLLGADANEEANLPVFDGITIPLFANSSLQLVIKLIVVNATRFPETAGFDFQRLDRIMTHELGHALGLSHSTIKYAEGQDGAANNNSDVPVMSPSVSHTVLRSDDLAWIRYLYQDVYEGDFDTEYHWISGTVSCAVTGTGVGIGVWGAELRAVRVEPDESDEYSFITLHESQGHGQRGFFEIPVPPGTYDLYVNQLPPDFRLADEPVALRQPFQPSSSPFRTLSIPADPSQNLRGSRLLRTEPDSLAEKRQLGRAVEQSAVVREVVPDLLTSPAFDFEKVARAIARLSGLSQSTAERRAQVLLAWRRQLA